MRTKQEDWNFKKFQGTADMLNIHNLKEIEEAAWETLGWIQDAVGDFAHGYEDFLDKRMKVKVDQAKKDGVIDIKGWLADEYYNDEDTLSDLLGDHIFDHATALAGIKDPGFSVCYIQICKVMLPRAHKAMANVLNRFIAEKKKRI
jgi:hypothetical protein